VRSLGLRHWTIYAATAIVLGIVVFAIASCGGSNSTTPTTASGGGTATTVATGGATVSISGFAFNPATITIKAGESVTWTNADSVTHTVVADNGEFTSSGLANGQTYSFTFAKAGTYKYHCSIHPTMTGTVVVQ
jgi:plastocyanin